MPIHDWTRVSAGTFHDFQLAWIAELRRVLNGGILPPDYYAQAEQIIGPLGPDILALQTRDAPPADDANGHHSSSDKAGGIAVATAPPRMRMGAEAEMIEYVLKRRTIIVRHSSDDRIVALLEIVSPGNKSGRYAIGQFVDKAVEALFRGYHLLIVDLFRPGPRDPDGIHGAIWEQITVSDYRQPADEPLTLAAYCGGQPKRAYVEPTAVGRLLIEMPLFLEPDLYVNVPLESTYLAAYEGVPRRWRSVIEGTA